MTHTHARAHVSPRLQHGAGRGRGERGGAELIPRRASLGPGDFSGVRANRCPKHFRQGSPFTTEESQQASAPSHTPLPRNREGTGTHPAWRKCHRSGTGDGTRALCSRACRGPGGSRRCLGIRRHSCWHPRGRCSPRSTSRPSRRS